MIVSRLGDVRRRLADGLVLPGNREWDLARAAWNLTADQHPAAVAFAATPEDVVAVVTAARDAGMRVASQATGHGAAPLPALDHTVLLRTSRLREVRIDAATRQATAAAGDVWLDVTRPASAAGLAPLAGSSPDVGVVGYTLGGGLGWLGRRYGLACNSVTAAQIVTADGQCRSVDADRDPDLFWAVRGGGGNYGVVTRLWFDLYPVPDLVAGWLAWPLEHAHLVLTNWLDWLTGIPETVTSTARLLRLPPAPELPDMLRNRHLVVIEAAMLCQPDTADHLLRRLRTLGPDPELDTFDAVKPVALSRLHLEPEQPVPVVAGQALLGDLPPNAVDALLVAAGPDVDSPLVAVELRHLGGALARPSPSAGALATLDGAFALLAAGAAPSAVTAASIEAAIASVADRLRPWHTGRSYANFAESRPADPHTLFPLAVHRRLARIKADVDADNLFVANHPIAPG